MSTNVDTVDLVGDTSTGQADLDLGLGAPSGNAGRDAVGYVFSQPFPGILRVTGSDGTLQDFALPPGLPGLPGLNGITPTFISGALTLQAFGSTPAIVVRSTTTLNTYAVDLYLPDPALSAVQANQAAGQAAASATAANTSAGQSASSASASQTSAGASASSASASQSSATASQASAAAAEASYDSFDDRYLGPKATDPTLDNDGNALMVGALYYNTGAQPGMRVRTAANTWDKAYAAITGGVTTFKGRDGAVVPMAGDYSAPQIAGLATRSLWLSMIY